MKTIKEIKAPTNKRPKLIDLCEKYAVPHEYREIRRMMIRIGASEIYIEKFDDNKSLIRRFLASDWITPGPGITQTSGMKWLPTKLGLDIAKGYALVEAEIEKWKLENGSLQPA